MCAHTQMLQYFRYGLEHLWILSQRVLQLNPIDTRVNDTVLCTAENPLELLG